MPSPLDLRRAEWATEIGNWNEHMLIIASTSPASTAIVELALAVWLDHG